MTHPVPAGSPLVLDKLPGFEVIRSVLQEKVDALRGRLAMKLKPEHMITRNIRRVLAGHTGCHAGCPPRDVEGVSVPVKRDRMVDPSKPVAFSRRFRHSHLMPADLTVFQGIDSRIENVGTGRG
ncbi:MAG: hypothetical protein OEV30_02050 [Ignavibacteria bacterium]|nr:hypothetical protein [Ignavibacteria bacterium]